MENDSHSDDCRITNFKKEDDSIALSCNIRVSTLPKTKSDQHFERAERKEQNNLQYYYSCSIEYIKLKSIQ